MYIHLRANTYHYRRRIPIELKQYIHASFFCKSLSKDRKTANILAKNFNSIFDELLIMVKLGLEPDIKKLKLKNQEESPLNMFLKVSRSYEADKTTRMHLSVLEELLPKDISTIKQNTIDEIISMIKDLPKRNIQKYKNYTITELIRLKTPHDDKLSARGINAYLKTLKSYLSFCYKRNYIEKPFDIKMVKQTTTTRKERLALDIDTVKMLVNTAKSMELKSAYNLLFLTGMRPSEAFKCKLTMVDDVLCFDLTDPNEKLKTQNSYRLIPVHHSISQPEQLLENLQSLSTDYLGKQCSSSLKEGTLYSLRHTFATQLASKSIEPHIISELLGHKHNGMTLNRYVKGFPIQTLKEAVDTLPSLN